MACLLITATLATVSGQTTGTTGVSNATSDAAGILMIIINVLTVAALVYLYAKLLINEYLPTLAVKFAAARALAAKRLPRCCCSCRSTAAAGGVGSDASRASPRLKIDLLRKGRAAKAVATAGSPASVRAKLVAVAGASGHADHDGSLSVASLPASRLSLAHLEAGDSIGSAASSVSDSPPGGASAAAPPSRVRERVAQAPQPLRRHAPNQALAAP